MDNDDAMKNERCLIKKINEFKEKIFKTCIVFIGLTFLMGFYDERNIHVELEEITIELGDILPNDKIKYINNYLMNSNFFLEDNVLKEDDGETNKIGTYDYYIVYRDEERKYSRITNKSSTISVIDTIKPRIKLKETSLKFEYGSNIKVTDLATCYDLSECKLYFKEEVDNKKEGVQDVVIVAQDEGNNITEKLVSITIKDKPKYSFNYDDMNQHNNMINSNLTDEEKENLRYALVEFAKQFEGNPYVYGGNSLTNGTDCSGFTKGIYNNFGYQLPRTASAQAYVGKKISKNELKPGDIIVYHYSSGGHHTGLYIGNGKMIHAATSKVGIIIAYMFEGNRTYHRIIY
ncbi:MAG: C40 family peptidase [Bacilli bacterium]|nr:C40 family peptidase [Bacilli bacterium]